MSSDLKVLIPVMLRPGLHPGLVSRAMVQAQELVEVNRRDNIECRIVVEKGSFPKLYEGENYYARLARLRQHVVDTHLEPDDHMVLWVDSDVTYQHVPNLLKSLLNAGAGVDITGPLTLIEGSQQNYDTAGLRESLEHRSGTFPPYLSKSGLVSVQCIGCCVLTPAWLHREIRFQAMPDNDPYVQTEWWVFCQESIKNGVQVLCDTSIQVYHAHLPSFGEAWH